jgi:hypothetical protein
MNKLYDKYAQQLATIPEGPNPLDVVCPHCKVKADIRCGHGKIATHKARYKAVGIDKPTIHDTRREFYEGELRMMRREAALQENTEAPGPKF